MTPFINKLVTAVLAPSSHLRWQLLGADGRVLDVNDSTSNHVGQSAVLAPPPLNNNAPIRQLSALLIARAETPRNPETVTISLNAIFAAPVPAGVLLIPQARISWGSGSGVVNVADIDITKGAQVTVSASVIQVDGVYFAPAGTGAVVINNCRISANLAYGTRGSQATAPGFTDIQTIAGAAGVGEFVIPNFAKDVIIYSDTVAGAPADLSFGFGPSDIAGSGVGALIIQNEGAAPNTVFPRVYPIPGYARRIVVTNNSVAAANVTVRFGLDL